jgi:hypothetical protein
MPYRPAIGEYYAYIYDKHPDCTRKMLLELFLRRTKLFGSLLHAQVESGFQGRSVCFEADGRLHRSCSILAQDKQMTEVSAQVQDLEMWGVKGDEQPST